jgi:hypothetical protein
VTISTKKVLWFFLLVIVVGYEVFGFVQLGRLHFHFQSTREMLLFVALLIVGFLGVLVKSRRSRS